MSGEMSRGESFLVPDEAAKNGAAGGPRRDPGRRRAGGGLVP